MMQRLHSENGPRLVTLWVTTIVALTAMVLMILAKLR
jgi:hypothetical protein